MAEIKLPYFEIIEERPAGLRSAADYTSWGVDKLDAPAAWSKDVTGDGVIVFVLDTEYLTDHPNIRPYVEPMYCRSFTGEESTGVGGHGLHVADTVRQVAPGVRLAFCKVLSDAGGGSSSGVASAIRYVADLTLNPEHKGYRRVINMSLGANAASSTIEAALKYAVSKGVFVVAAAGNDGKDVDFPGAFDEQVIAVGAVDKALKPASFSSPGPAVDLAAPGVAIEAAWKTGTAVLSGTSMASPHVAGVTALVLEMAPEIKTQGQLEDFLERHAFDIHTGGRDDKTGWGFPVVTRYFSEDPEPPKPEPGTGTPWWVWVIAGAVVVGGLIFYFITR